MGDIVGFLSRNTQDIESVCELGAGQFANFPYYKCPIRIGIELIKTYVDNKVAGSDYITQAICGDATKFDELLDREVDAFAIIDFLEHIEKDVAIDLIKRLQKKSRRIFIFVPHGTHNQDGTESYDFGDKNLRSKLGETGQANDAIEAQRHKSKWYVKDLEELGFVVDHDKHHHKHPSRFDKNLMGEDGGTVMWAVWNK